MAKAAKSNEATMKAHNYFGFSSWGDKDKWGSVAGQFDTDIGPEPRFVYAVYSTPAYEGSATVIFYRDGQWFEAGGGHCSCYGLEGQWDPTMIDPADHLEALKQGKRWFLPYDTEGDYPEATPEAFDEWLHWAVKEAATTNASS